LDSLLRRYIKDQYMTPRYTSLVLRYKLMRRSEREVKLRKLMLFDLLHRYDTRSLVLNQQSDLSSTLDLCLVFTQSLPLSPRLRLRLIKCLPPR
jgi:hypothetical protein